MKIIASVFLQVLTEEPLSRESQLSTTVAILLLLCFITSSWMLSRRTTFLSFLFHDLVKNKDKSSIFFESVGAGLSNKLILCAQTIILLSILAFSVLAQRGYFISADLSAPQISLYMASILAFSILFFVYKLLSYTVVGTVFYSKETVNKWMNTFLALMGFSGLFLLIPTALFLYVDLLRLYTIHLLVLFLLVLFFVLCYKAYLLFFQERIFLHHLFLYLCAQEIIPLLFLYKGLGYLINFVVQNNTLWL